MRTDRWASVVMVASLLALPALAGCVGTAGATAMEHRSVAGEEASEWSQGASLVQIVGVEGSWNMTTGFAGSMGESGEAYWDRAEDDPNPGNGHAEVWVYRFVDSGASEAVFSVAVDESGEVLGVSEGERSSGMVALGEWSVDSDEAMEIALDMNSGLRDASQTENVGLVSVLYQEEDRENPVWRIAGGGGDASGGGGGSVLLDAVTGEVLESMGGFAPR